jgi:type II secretory pathway component PulF
MASADAKPGPPPPAETPSRRSGLGLRHLMLAVVWVAIGLVILKDYWRPLLFLALTLGPIALIAGGIVVLVQRRKVQQDALLQVLAIGAERQMPLGPGLEAFAGLCGRPFRLRAQSLAYLLQNGVPLPEALANVPGVLTRPAALLACVGWSQGNLAGGLREAQASEANRRHYRAAFLPKLGYLGGVFLFMQFIGGFILYFIAPKFEAIFMDFGVALPEATKLTIRVGQVIGGSVLGPLLILAELAFLVYVPFAIFGFVRWEPPLAGVFLWRRDTAAVLRALAVGVEAGEPIPKGLALIESMYPRAGTRRRLARARVLVEQGTDWTDALHERGLIDSADAAVLESAQRAGNLAWALKTQADAHERRLGYRLQLWAELLFPIVVLLAGAVVAIVAVGYMMPLVSLISSLAR